jgi:hypothetical protein
MTPYTGTRNSHQTTLRFPKEMWAELERAAARLGISVAQYVRDAARSRLAEERPPGRESPGDALLNEVERQGVVEHSYEQLESSAALWEQGRLARERARLLRDESRKRRAVT